MYLERQAAMSDLILLIEDDRRLAGMVSDFLRQTGFAVEHTPTGEEGLARLARGGVSAIVLDLMLPGLDGFDVLKGIRRHNDVPVLMLTALGEEADRIVGLEIGADDYLPKTFSTRELLARLRAVMRRSARTPPETRAEELAVGPLRINASAHTAALEDKPLVLTAVEFDLLASLARSRGRVKTREQLLEEVRTRNYDVFDRSIDVHIAALRRKLGDDAKEPRFIRTIRAVGYMLINPDE